MAGSHEVRGSIPLGSTIEMIDQEKSPGLFPALRPNKAWRGRGNLDSRYIAHCSLTLNKSLEVPNGLREETGQAPFGAPKVRFFLT